MESPGTSPYYAVAMLWELWALILGFGIPPAPQVSISNQRMVNDFGHNGLKDIFLAMSFGAASSSCSYAAAATTETVFKKGAAFIPSMAFMIASTNLMVELGIVLYILMGWRFVPAEFVGAFVMVGVVWLIFGIHPPKKRIEAARRHRERANHHGCHDHKANSETSSQIEVGHALFMEGSMLWKEIVIGVVLAGFLMMCVPKNWWEAIFISHGPHAPTLVENALAGPLIAIASFVCSMGNIPLASLPWSSGATFGGALAFLYADLIVLSLIVAYRKYYGLPATLYIVCLLYAGMAWAGITVDLAFTWLGLVPPGGHGMAAMKQTGFSWNYARWLNIAALLEGGYLLHLHFRQSDREKHKRARARQEHHAY